MTPDKAELVLRDYRSGKATSASALAKAHGVSRSAVYRLLSKSGDPAPKVPELKVTEQVLEAAPRRPPRDVDEDKEPLDLFTKADRFADALGLPDGSGKVSNEEPKDEKDREEKEQQLDMMMEAIIGGGGGGAQELPSGLLEAIEGPPRPRLAHRNVEESTAPIHIAQSRHQDGVRNEITQKIIFNLQHFGPQLEIITGTNKELYIQSLTQLTTPQLREALTTLERTRSVGNIANGFKQVFFVAAQTTEIASSFVGLRSQGFTQQLRQQDEEITMIMKELAIEQWDRLKVMDTPTARLGVLFCLTLAQTDARNRLEEHLKAAETVPPDLVSANADL
jgi:hypothetical protein